VTAAPRDKTEIRHLSKRWYETHHVLTSEEQHEALAHTLARELTAGATWDGIGGLKERGLIRSAPEGRALLRERAGLGAPEGAR
jgi:hypothetical protein